MLSKLFVAAIAATTVAAKTVDLTNYTFEKFMSEHNLKFPPAEIESRRATFVAELARVKAHNAKNLSWKEGMNKHSVLSAAEKKAFKGRHKGVARSQNKMLKNARPLPANFEIKPLSFLPKEVDWRKKGMSRVSYIC